MRYESYKKIFKGGNELDNKMFELMEKMYIEFTSFKTDIKDIKHGFNCC